MVSYHFASSASDTCSTPTNGDDHFSDARSGSSSPIQQGTTASEVSNTLNMEGLGSTPGGQETIMVDLPTNPAGINEVLLQAL
jgi:hypothetical protein